MDTLKAYNSGLDAQVAFNLVPFDNEQSELMAGALSPQQEQYINNLVSEYAAQIVRLNLNAEMIPYAQFLKGLVAFGIEVIEGSRLARARLEELNGRSE